MQHFLVFRGRSLVWSVDAESNLKAVEIVANKFDLKTDELEAIEMENELE